MEILLDAAGRPVEAAHALRGRLDATVLNAHPGGHDNSIAWLLWHAGRELDVQLADLSGADQVWIGGGFRDRFDLGELGDQVGFGFTGDQARALVVSDPDLLLEYLDATTDAVRTYIGTLDEQALGVVIDDAWDPPVTRGARLVSIIDDAVQHVGQAAYAAGMPPAGADGEQSI